ncbi:MAG: EAL domain-containing protein [Xanthomonadales bacterium]|nr:EAL domain-containing protein [Xanthomonadales bacterium]
MIQGSEFIDRAGPALLEALDRGASCALLRVRLRGLRSVAMRIGYAATGSLMDDLVERAKGVLREGDQVAAIGPGELAVLLVPVRDDQHAMLAATRLLRLYAELVDIGAGHVDPDAAIGVALSPDHGTTADQLCRRAEQALHRAVLTPDRFTLHSHDVGIDVLDAETLRGAIRNASLGMAFQPVWDLRGDRLAGAEALARWHHPDLGEVSPIHFVALAERSGLISEFTRWSLHTALQTLAGARRAGFDLPISINMSARAFGDRGLTEQVADALRLWGVPPFMIELEVTETAMLDAPELGGIVLGQLHDEGVCVAIDDFGVGSSSFTYLRDLPVDRIKIDRSFVGAILTSRRCLTLVHGMIDLAHRLGMSVVAEGVEDGATLDRLRALGCDFAQGFEIGRPMAMSDLLTRYVHNAA